MSDDVRRKMFDEFRDELYKRELSNSESFDKAVLSLSSAGLAISLTYIKSIVPIEEAIYIQWLYAAWVLFGISIVSTLLSLMASQLGIYKQLDIAEEYYLKKNKQAFEEKNFFAQTTNILNGISGVVFITAIISVITFSIANFNFKNTPQLSGDKCMTDTKNVKLNDGQSVPQMQRVDVTKGANIPRMQAVPQTQTQSTPVQPQTTEKK